MLQPHDLLPHFEAAGLGGERVLYSSIWQRKNLVLVMLPDSGPPSQNYADRLLAKVRGLERFVASSDTRQPIVDPQRGRRESATGYRRFSPQRHSGR